MKRVIIVGSPRSNGRSAHVAEMLFEVNIEERPQDELFLVPLSEIEVGPCIGCGACRQLSEVIVAGEDGEERSEMRPRCVFDDDMQTVYDLLDDADELTVVSPVYFSGAPSTLKCLLDRMQPYFYANTRANPKRPAELHVLGEGGDPYGYDALVSEVSSSLACAGFRVQRVLDWVGKVTPEGDIVEEAEVRQPTVFAVAASQPLDEDEFEELVEVGAEEDAEAAGVGAGAAAAGKAAGNKRPKLDFSAAPRGAAKGRGPAREGGKPTGSGAANRRGAGKGAGAGRGASAGRGAGVGRGAGGKQSGKGTSGKSTGYSNKGQSGKSQSGKGRSSKGQGGKAGRGKAGGRG